MEPIVSVIIPVHNRLSFLQTAVASVLKQSYTNIEIIVIDDASNPSAAAALPTDERISIIRSEQNNGPGTSREFGRLTARGEFIQYLDSDDYLHPEKIARQVDQMLANPSISMCYCTSLIFEGLPLPANPRIWSISEQSYCSILPVILYQRPWATSSCLWRKDTIDKIGAWSSLWIGEDIDYEVRAGCIGIQIEHVLEPLCYIRKNSVHSGLTDLSVEHHIEETNYKIKVAENIYQSNYRCNEEISRLIINKLYNQAIFLLAHGKKEFAIKCLITAKLFIRNNNFLLSTFISLCNVIPTEASVVLGRKIRNRITLNK